MTSTTLKKISEVLGLSISTISRALKDHPDISADTKRKVLETASMLDYEPNINAIHLRTKRSNVFGLIVPTTSNYFYGYFIESIEEECRKNNFSLIILQSADKALVETENVKFCRQHRVTGLFACISSENKNRDAYEKLKEYEIPVIFFDNVPEEDDCNKVCFADAVSATFVAKEILSKNKKSILALYGNPLLSISKKRQAAFTAACKENSKTVVLHSEHVLNAAQAEAMTDIYLQKKKDCIFCMSDEILTGVMKSVQKNNLKIPSDISIIAMSNGFIPKLYYPEITYAKTSAYELGKLAFSCMLSCLAGGAFTKEITTESVLVKGGSI